MSENAESAVENVWVVQPDVPPQFPYKSGPTEVIDRGSVEVTVDGCFSDGDTHYLRGSVPKLDVSLPVPILGETTLRFVGDHVGRVVPTGEGLLPDRAWFYARLVGKNRPDVFSLEWFRSAGAAHLGERLRIKVVVPDDCLLMSRLPERFTGAAAAYLNARSQLGGGHIHPAFKAMATLVAEDGPSSSAGSKPISSYEVLELPTEFRGVQTILAHSMPKESKRYGVKGVYRGDQPTPDVTLRTARVSTRSILQNPLSEEVKSLVRRVPNDALVHLSKGLKTSLLDEEFIALLKPILDLSLAGQETESQGSEFSRSIAQVWDQIESLTQAPVFVFSLEPHVYGGTDLTMVLYASNPLDQMNGLVGKMNKLGWVKSSTGGEDAHCFRSQDGLRQLCFGVSEKTLMIGNHPAPIVRVQKLPVDASLSRDTDFLLHLKTMLARSSAGHLSFIGHGSWERFFSPQSRMRRARHRKSQWSAIHYRSWLRRWLGDPVHSEQDASLPPRVLDFDSHHWNPDDVDGYRRFVENWQDIVRLKLHPTSLMWLKGKAGNTLSLLFTSIAKRSWLSQMMTYTEPRPLHPAPLGLGMSIAFSHDSPLRMEAGRQLKRFAKRRDIELTGFGQQVIVGLADQSGILDNILTFFPIPSADSHGLEALLERKKKALMTLPIYAVVPIEKPSHVNTALERLHIAINDHASEILTSKPHAVYRAQKIRILEEQLSEPGHRVTAYYCVVDTWFIAALDRRVLMSLIDGLLDQPPLASSEPMYVRLNWNGIDGSRTHLAQALNALYRGYFVPRIRGQWRQAELSAGEATPIGSHWTRRPGMAMYGEEWTPRWPSLTVPDGRLGPVLSDCSFLDLTLKPSGSDVKQLQLDVRCESHTSR